MKASIERFNARYYHPNSPPVPSIYPLMAGIPPGGGGVAAGEGGGAGMEGGAVAEEEPPVPLDHNYLSMLSKKVNFFKSMKAQ